jgi:hypothetical protein|tara:strand:- start:317 stop:553 length:237 start_codon:yes stop_codon:yes gene_type:complete
MGTNSMDSAKTAVLNTEALVRKYMEEAMPVPHTGLMKPKSPQGIRPMQQGDKKLLDAKETVAKAVADIRKMRQGLKNG